VSFLVQLGGLLAQSVEAPVDVGVVLLVEAKDCLNNLPRLLCRRSIVEVYYRPPSNLPPQNGEILSDLADVEQGDPRARQFEEM